MLQELEIKKIVEPEVDSRFYRDQYFQNFLSEDLKKENQLIPILVRTLPNGMYEVIDGQTRLRALRSQNVKSVKCDVRQISDQDVLVYRIKLNTVRKHADFMGLAIDLKMLKEKYNFSLKQLVERFGWQKSWLCKLLALNRLSHEDKIAVSLGNMSVTDGYRKISQRRIPLSERDRTSEQRQITCTTCGRKENEGLITFAKLCMRCSAVLSAAHERTLKLEKTRRKHKPLIS